MVGAWPYTRESVPERPYFPTCAVYPTAHKISPTGDTEEARPSSVESQSTSEDIRGATTLPDMVMRLKRGWDALKSDGTEGLKVGEVGSNRTTRKTGSRSRIGGGRPDAGASQSLP